MTEHIAQQDDGTVRKFATGATRDTSVDKLDYDGFLSPLVLQRYAQYMHKNRKQSDGTMRAGDNWQKGIPTSEYRRSAWRHFMDFWASSRGWGSRAGIEEAICGLLFNLMGYLHELLRTKLDPSAPKYRIRLGHNILEIADMPEFLEKLKGLPVMSGTGEQTGKIEAVWLEHNAIKASFTTPDGSQEITLYEITTE